jgi:type IV secretion system protein VirB4
LQSRASPSWSEPAILNELDQHSTHYRWSTRFIALDPVDANTQLDKQRRKWSGKARKLMDQILGKQDGQRDQDADDMSLDAAEAQAEAASNLVAFGYYTSVVVLYGGNQDVLDRTARKIVRSLGNLGFVARVETLNAADAYIGSLPGNVVANVRRPPHPFTQSQSPHPAERCLCGRPSQSQSHVSARLHRH